jgi:hypothetical protein
MVRERLDASRMEGQLMIDPAPTPNGWKASI